MLEFWTLTNLFKTLFLNLAYAQDKKLSLTFFIQVYINCLNSFLIKRRIKVGVGLRHKKKIFVKAVFKLELSLTKIIVKYIIELC